MCVLCGTPDPSHDLLLLRVAAVTLGTGGILAPRHWLVAARRCLGRLAGRLAVRASPSS